MTFFLFVALTAVSHPGNRPQCPGCAMLKSLPAYSPLAALAHDESFHTAPMPAMPYWYCIWVSYYNQTGQFFSLWEQLPSSKWAVKFSPPNICTVWTVNLNFEIKKNSTPPKQDTLDIFLHEAVSPYNQIYKSIWLINPSEVESIYPLYPPLGAPSSTGQPIINTKRDFLLAMKMRGPSTDSVKWFFRTPAAEPNRSYKFITPTTLQTATQATGTSVDIYAMAELCIKIPFPVELSSLTAFAMESGVRLDWETASEVNNYGFVIERSLMRDGPWEPRGFVKGSGTTMQRQRYSFTDESDVRATGNAVWYRLTQMDTDGAQHEYDPLLVELYNATSGFALDACYPNPVTASSGTTTLRYRMDKAEHVTITITDMIGRTVQTVADEEKQPGIHQTLVTIHDLPAGTYLVQMSAGAFKAARKLAITR